MYCEACGKPTDGGRCRACGRRPARLALTVYSLLFGWFALLAMLFLWGLVYPTALRYFSALGVDLPLPTRIVAPIGVPFGNPWFALVAAIVLLLLAIAFRRMRADKWFALIVLLLVILHMISSVVVGMPALSLANKLNG